MNKLKRDLKEEPVPTKLTRGEQIIAACAPTNTDIGTVTTELAAFTAAQATLTTDFNAAQLAQSEATRLAGIQLDSETAWKDEFEMLLLAVEKNTKGDKAKLETTTVPSFEPGRAPALPAPDRPENVAVSLGDMEHEQEITWDGQRPMPRFFKVRMCEAPFGENKMAEVGSTTGSRYVKKGQTPGTMYCFQVCACGTGDKHSPWSDPAQGMAT